MKPSIFDTAGSSLSRSTSSTHPAPSISAHAVDSTNSPAVKPSLMRRRAPRFASHAPGSSMPRKTREATAMPPRPVTVPGMGSGEIS
ncbi:MAG: hypothetical protein ACOX9C_09295 [Kiritimatiellia bacterium]